MENKNTLFIEIENTLFIERKFWLLLKNIATLITLDYYN
jgi:hypothetical protein